MDALFVSRGGPSPIRLRLLGHPGACPWRLASGDIHERAHFPFDGNQPLLHLKLGLELQSESAQQTDPSKPKEQTEPKMPSISPSQTHLAP